MFGKEFTKEYSKGVYKLSLTGWDQFPHYSAAYYDEDEELISLNAMTDRGFRKLVDRLNTYGYDLTYESDVRVNMAMVKVTGDMRFSFRHKFFWLHPDHNHQKDSFLRSE